MSTVSKPLTSVTAVILAGGRARRMGNADKGLLVVSGQPMVGWVIQRLRKQVRSIYINVNRHHEEYAALGYPIISDAIGGFVGPLAGIHAGMISAQTQWLLSVPCDCPFLPLDLASRLYHHALETKSSVAVAIANHRSQPVFLLVQCQLANDLEAYLKEGESKIDRWYQRHRVAEVVFEEGDAFANINTAEDLNWASSQLPCAK